MSYNETHSELPDHPKMLRFKRALKISIPTALGHLELLWRFTMNYAPNGDLSKFTAGDIAEKCLWEGDEQVFVDALVNCKLGEGSHGFLERTEDGKLIIHDWWQYGGKLIVKRWCDAYRKRTNRTATVAEMIAAGLPLPPVVIAEYYAQNAPATPSKRDIAEDEAPSVGNPSEVVTSSVGRSDYRAGREEQQSKAERSEEQQHSSEEESTRGEPKPSGESPPAAAAAVAYGEGEEMPKAQPLPAVSAPSSKFTVPNGENPRVWVDKMLAISPRHWGVELQKRYVAANAGGKIRSEWPWKAKLLADWLNGTEPPPDAPPSAKPPAKVQSAQSAEESRRLSDEAVNAAKEASLPKIQEIQAQLAEKMRSSGSAPPSAGRSQALAAPAEAI